MRIQDMFDLKIGEYLKDVYRYIKDECELLSEEVEDGHHYRIYENKKEGTYVFTCEVTLGAPCVFAELAVGNYEGLLENEIQEYRFGGKKDEEWIIKNAKRQVMDNILEECSPSFCNRWHH